DVHDHHLTRVEATRGDGEPDLPAVEGHGQVRVDDCAGDLAGRGVDTRRKVDGHDLRPRCVDPPDQLRRVGARLASETGPEERVDDDLVSVDVARLVDGVPLFTEGGRRDAPVTAVRTPAADAREARCGRKRTHRLARDGSPGTLHALGE